MSAIRHTVTVCDNAPRCAAIGPYSLMKNNLLRRTLFIAVSGCIGLAVAAPGHAGGLSATRPVIAILDGELFVGEAKGRLDGSGNITIRSQQNSSLTCLGEFTTSAAAAGGSGTLSCSDGGNANFRIQRLTVFKGHGAGTTSRGTMSFSYGLSMAESQAYLKLPDGKKIGSNGIQLALVDR